MVTRKSETTFRLTVNLRTIKIVAKATGVERTIMIGKAHEVIVIVEINMTEIEETEKIGTMRGRGRKRRATLKNQQKKYVL